MRFILFWLVAGGLLLHSGTALAQADTTQFVCYLPIEPMPELPGGGGMPAIVAAIKQRIAYPPQALRAGASGRVFVSFTVAPSGQVLDVFVVKAFRRDCGLAAVRAVRQLPRFKLRLAKYGKVRYVAPITFRIDGNKPIGPLARQQYHQMARRAAGLRNSTR